MADAVEYQAKIVADIERELAETTRERMQVLVETRRTCSQIDETRDAKIVASLAPLNRRANDLGNRALFLQKQLEDARRRLAFAVEQRGEQARYEAHLRHMSLEKTAWFLVKTPDGRTIRHQHASADALAEELAPGYVVEARIFGTDKSGRGGFAVSLSTSAKDIAAMLEAAT